MRRDDSSFESAQATSRDRGGLHDSANLADAASRGSPRGSPFAPPALVEGGTATRALAETIIRGLLGKRSEKMASKAAARRSCGVPRQRSAHASVTAEAVSASSRPGSHRPQMMCASFGSHHLPTLGACCRTIRLARCPTALAPIRISFSRLPARRNQVPGDRSHRHQQRIDCHPAALCGHLCTRGRIHQAQAL
eukprot:COSAG02_NODE_96_length_37408_cov_9.762604_11_plen_194_part_00